MTMIETLPQLTRGRKLAFTAIMLLLMIAAMLAFLELAVRVVFPQPELYSERYGHLLPASATIVNQLPGAWRFVYHTNEYGYRVSMPELSSRYDLPNVVVLGDSFTFGTGVNDGEEYPAVLAKQLAAKASIVNLGVGGFGLTQEIRTFYEFGLLFQPAVVVLQFCSNDPDDNFYAKVTTVEDGRLRFHRDQSMGSGLTGSAARSSSTAPPTTWSEIERTNTGKPASSSASRSATGSARRRFTTNC